MLKNLLKEKLDAGKNPVGTFFCSGSACVAECLGYTGLDFIVIDAEHSDVDAETATGLIRAAELHGVTPVVRAKDGTRPSILKMLDAGAHALIIPNVHTPDEARGAVDYAKYTPVGRRGYAKGRRAGFGYEDYAVELKRYLRESNEQTLLFPMCETVGAFEHIEEIAAIDGVDGIFVGPYDLSLDMGIPGEFAAPEFQAALKRVAAVCREAGKYSMIFAGTPDTAKEYIRLGYQSAAVGTDTDAVIRAYRSVVESVRG